MCVESLEPGQVWELVHDGDSFTPGLLLSLYEDRVAPGHVALYWRVLDLPTGEVYSASVTRWSDLAREHGRHALVGRSLL